MADLCGLTTIKRFTYRGDATEEYSNTYHFTGAVPSSGAAWKTLADALIAVERTVVPSTVSVVRAYGYNDDSDSAVAVWQYDYLEHGAAVAGNLTPGASGVGPGDAAVWARWKTDRLNSRGKPVYLRKYYHPAMFGTTRDDVYTGQKTALEALATKFTDGSFLDARLIRSRTHDDTIVTSGASTYITTRTLKRRGRRP